MTCTTAEIPPGDSSITGVVVSIDEPTSTPARGDALYASIEWSFSHEAMNVVYANRSGTAQRAGVQIDGFWTDHTSNDPQPNTFGSEVEETEPCIADRYGITEAMSWPGFPQRPNMPGTGWSYGGTVTGSATTWEVTIECTKRNQQGDVVEIATATLVHSCQPNPGNCA